MPMRLPPDVRAGYSRAVGRDPTLGWRVALVALGVWAILPPYLTPVDVASSVEFVDHVIPGGLVIIFGTVGLLEARAGAGDRALAFTADGICLLAGLWITLTHITLLLDAGDPGKPWGSAVAMISAGPAIALLAGWLMLRPSEAR
jgi:hypothetical protein